VLAATLSIAGPDGQVQLLFARGARAPATGRAVFATQRAGERTLEFRLLEGEGHDLVGTLRAALPPGLPPNTWLSVFVESGDDHVVRVRVRENLRRIDVTPEVDATGRRATVYTVSAPAS
jgi:hypothetical protein